MRQGRIALCILFVVSCVDITVNNGDGVGGAKGAAVCNVGGANGSTSPVDAAADSVGTSTPPRATDSITLAGNLDQTAAARVWNSQDPKNTSSFTTSMTVYDSLGKAIQVDIYFGKDAVTPAGDSGAWTYYVMTDGANLAFQGDGVTPAAAGTITQIAGGTLRYDTSGRLISNTPTFQGFYPKAAVGPQPITFNLGTGTSVGGNGLDGLTQYAATSAISVAIQSGSPPALSL